MYMVKLFILVFSPKFIQRCLFSFSCFSCTSPFAAHEKESLFRGIHFRFPCSCFLALQRIQCSERTLKRLQTSWDAKQQRNWNIPKSGNSTWEREIIIRSTPALIYIITFTQPSCTLAQFESPPHGLPTHTPQKPTKQPPTCLTQ